ncbi:hypothetical protein HK097_004087, partial [Rhizophlyctis rosea]
NPRPAMAGEGYTCPGGPKGTKRPAGDDMGGNKKRGSAQIFGPRRSLYVMPNQGGIPFTSLNPLNNKISVSDTKWVNKQSALLTGSSLSTKRNIETVDDSLLSNPKRDNIPTVVTGPSEMARSNADRRVSRADQPVSGVLTRPTTSSGSLPMAAHDAMNTYGLQVLDMRFAEEELSSDKKKKACILDTEPRPQVVNVPKQQTPQALVRKAAGKRPQWEVTLSLGKRKGDYEDSPNKLQRIRSYILDSVSTHLGKRNMRFKDTPNKRQKVGNP